MAQEMRYTGGDEGITTDQCLPILSTLLADESFLRALFLWGPTGIGKSSVTRQALMMAQGVELESAYRNPQGGSTHAGVEMIGEWGLIDLRVSLLDASELRGIPFPHEELTRWLPPEELPLVGHEGRFPPKGLLFLDELNLAEPSVQAACYSLILDRKVGPHQLLPGWKVMAAGNLRSENANTFELAHPLKNRFLHYKLRANLDAFKRWGLTVGLHSQVITFLNQNPQFLHMDISEDAYAFPTPRSWEFASDILYRIHPDYIYHSLEACLGHGAASALYGFIEVNQQLEEKYTSEYILKHKKYPSFGSHDALTAWATCSRLIGHLQLLPKDKRLNDYIGALHFFSSPSWAYLRDVGKMGLSDLKMLDEETFTEALAQEGLSEKIIENYRGFF